MNIIKTYYQLTKPGIIYGNAITAAAGFFLAAKAHINFGLFLVMLIGLSLVIASGCVFNNCIDRDIDAKMARTKNRAMVKKLVPVQNAIVFATLLGLIGFFLLALYTNFLTVILGFIGFFFYVIMYGIGKRRSVHGTVIGSISGALPPVVGYCAVSNNFDIGALLLFLILVFWQMPHFYAIAIYRLHDYASAGIPVLPVKKGIFITKIQIVLYAIAFIAACVLLTVFKVTGYTYLVLITLLGLGWLAFGINGFRTKDTTRWAKKMFLFSLVIILSLSILLSLNIALP